MGKVPVNLRMKQDVLAGTDTLQTIIELHSIRNKIAHPKLKNNYHDITITSTDGLIKKNPSDSYVLPENNFDLYIGYQKMIHEFNARKSLHYIREVLMAVIELKELFEIKEDLDWSMIMYDKVKSMTLSENELDTLSP